MFISAIFADHDEVRRLDKAVESELRQGRPDNAAALIEPAIAALEAAGHPFAIVCRASAAEHLSISGWEDMLERYRQLDNPDCPITAIGIDLSPHGEGGGDVPYLETSFYTDSAFPFSTSSRAVLLRQGYDEYSAAWQGIFEDIDSMVRVTGFKGLSEGVEALEAECKWGSNENPLDHDAMRIGQALRALRVHQAIRTHVLANGLPRPLTIIVGSNESAPFYDAPVITPDELDGALAGAPVTPQPDAPSPEAPVGTSFDPISPGPQIEHGFVAEFEAEAEEPVAECEEESASDRSDDAYAPLTVAYEPPAPPPAEQSVSGTELRRRLRASFVQADNDDGAAAPKRNSRFGRFFARR